MFDPRAYATDGLYPGLNSTMSIANQGSFLDKIIAAVKKTIQAITAPYVAVKTAVETFAINAMAAADSKVKTTASTATIRASIDSDSKVKTTTGTNKISADTDSYRGKVRVTKKKSIKVE